MQSIKLTLLAIVALCQSSNILAAEFQVLDSQAISIYQLDFPTDDTPLIDSAVGMLDANLIALRSQSGIEQGYINMVLNGEWVVRNTRVLPDSEYPYSNVATQFDLGTSEGTDVTSLDAVILFSDDVKTSAPSGNPSTFNVSSMDISQGGFSEEDQFGAGSSTAPPSLTDILFTDPSNSRAIFQLDHPNIQAANNQCYPMAIANSLQFLENTTGLNLPHSHVAGLKGDQSLVGQLGTHMNRNVTSRAVGNGVGGNQGLTGKMNYLLANGLEDRIQTRHWGQGGGANVSVTSNGKTATSTGQGTAIDFNKVVEALEGGENCEVGYLFPNGGHFVDIVAAGITNGQPWMIEASDLNQSSDTAGAGASGMVFSHLKDTNNNGRLNMNGGNQELALLICQKYIPPVDPEISIIPLDGSMIELDTGMTVTGVDDPAGHSCCVFEPPDMVKITVDTAVIDPAGNSVDVGDGSPSPPWLPMPFSFEGTSNPQVAMVSGTNMTTVAGFSNVQNTFSGTITTDKIEGQISLGTNGALPTGQPITYDVEIAAPEGGWPWLAETQGRSTAVRVNGFRNSHTINAADPFALSIGVTPGNSTSPSMVEWWVVAQTNGLVLSFDVASNTWSEGLFAATTGPVEAIGNETIFSVPTGGVPPGDYTFYFGIDDTINNVVDEGSLDFDFVTLSVQ